MPSFQHIILAAMILLTPSPSLADIFRYETKDGEILLSTQPKKGLKLIEVIRDTPITSTHANTKTPSKRQPSQTDAPPRDSQYTAFIEEASNLYNIPPEFIRAVIKVESNFNPRAVSRVGAMGLMQLMPATAEHMRVEDPFDPRQNILGGTRYLRRLSDRYDGDINLVLSGYHAGPGNVDRVGGIPFEKTQQYVKNVYAWYLKFLQQTENTKIPTPK